LEKNKFNILEKLISHNLAIIEYFQTDITKYKLLILVFKNYYNKNSQTIEDTINELPKNISSRAHKLNCITDLTFKGYLIKETINSDLRKKCLIPSESLIKEFNEYIKIVN
tara:strand:+ start:268 stop:600 length:333 start_codon:yes stop_codon:yes gene_type:complete